MKTTVEKGSFAVGIDWKYDDYEPWSVSTGSRAKIEDPEYRVYPRYKDLKEEGANYKYLNIDEIQEITIKAQKYLETTIAKSLKDSYGHENDDGIKINHLMSIIMYCDFTELSRDFTLSFRKSHRFQTLQQIKKHNSRYFWWSKILKETINLFGQRRNNAYGAKGELSHLNGPFFCGMSVILNIAQFHMFIHSPLSTSAQIHVAIRFSGAKGMILEMDNSRVGWDLKGMDVSWISRFREEDERYDYNHTLFIVHVIRV